MKMTRRTFLLAASAFAGRCGAADAAPFAFEAAIDLKRWRRLDPATFPLGDGNRPNVPGSGEWRVSLAKRTATEPTVLPYKAPVNKSGASWHDIPFRVLPLRAPPDEPDVKPGTERVARRWMLPVEDGYLLARDMGEWGGDIWWISADGSAKYRVSEHQADTFLKTDHGIFATEGLAHLGTNEGQVLRLIRSDLGKWRAEPFAPLPDAPCIATVDKRGDAAFVATYGNLVRIELAGPAVGRTWSLAAGAFWGGLNPNSIVQTLWDDIYMGMRGGVAHVGPSGRDGKRRVSFLVPPETAGRPAKR